MNCELREDLHQLLEKLPAEVSLDLSDVRRLREQPSVQKRIESMIQNHRHKDRLFSELFGVGPLTTLLGDESITEIIVNGADSIWLEREGRFSPHPDQFLSKFTLSQFVQRICAEARIKLDLSQPFADGSWQGWRVHLAQAPLVSESHTICLRRHPQVMWRLEDLIERKWCTHEEAAKLRELISTRKNILLVGPTGTGKTSVLAALLAEVPANERIVIIEDTPEIHALNPFTTKLFTRMDQQGLLRDFDQTDLVKQSLRMRPQRLIVGEVRGSEAKDYLLALSTGHAGSLGSLHASSARQALMRLEMLIQMGAPAWTLETIRQLILLGLDYVIVLEMRDGHRSLEGIYKICSLEKCGFLIERI